jgi:hypothetical protein
MCPIHSATQSFFFLVVNSTIMSSSRTLLTQRAAPICLVRPDSTRPIDYAQSCRQLTTSTSETTTTTFNPTAVSTPSPLIAVDSDLKNILSQFRAPVRFAFAYGSGVFRQEGYNYFGTGGKGSGRVQGQVGRV